MKRRNFLATLFATLIARFSPKPKPAGEDSIYRGFADYVGTPNPMFSHLISNNVGTFEGGEQLAEIFIYPKESV